MRSGLWIDKVAGVATRSFLLAAIFALASAYPAAAEHRFGLGALYWRSLDDIGDIGLDEDGVAPYLTYQYAPEGLFRLELDLEYYSGGVAGSTSAAYSPVAFLLLEFGIYGGLGAGITFSDELSDNVSDPFYCARLGWDFVILPKLHLDLSANYRADTFKELEDFDQDSVTFAAAARVAF